MKHLALVLTAALLVFTLTACGCSADQAGTTAGTQTENAGGTNHGADSGNGTDSVMPGNNANPGTDNGMQNGADRPFEEGMNDVTNGIGNAMDDVADGIGNAVDDVTGGNAADSGGVTYGQMLENGRLRK